MALNGRLPAADLVVIPWDGRDLVRTYALASLVRLNAAFRAAFGHDLVVNEGYRDYATQEKYYKNPPSGSGTAAKPGASNHGWGLAVDLKLRGDEYAWMLANAPRFGWVNPLWARDDNPRNGAREPWHWEHVGAPAVVPDAITPTPAPEEDDMAPRYIRDADSGTIAIGALGVFHVELPGPDYVTLLDGWGLWDRSKDLNLPGNIYAMVKSWSTPGGVDPALASKLDALIAAINADPTPNDDMTQEDLDRIARAVNDEAARRMGA